MTCYASLEMSTRIDWSAWEWNLHASEKNIDAEVSCLWVGR